MTTVASPSTPAPDDETLDFYAILKNAGISDAQIENMVAAGLIPSRVDLMSKDLEYAEGMGAESPYMRRVGRIAQAATPLEFAGTLAQRYVGNRERENIRAQQERAFDELAKLRSSLVTAGRRTPPAPSAGGGANYGVSNSLPVGRRARMGWF